MHAHIFVSIIDIMCLWLNQEQLQQMSQEIHKTKLQLVKSDL